MCWWCCFRASMAREGDVEMQRLSGKKKIMLKGHNKLWHPKRPNKRSRVSVTGTDQDIGWVVWQSEHFYFMFGKVVQQEGTQKKVRFVTRGRGNRLIVGKKQNDTPTISVNVTDPRLFMVIGSYQSNDLHLKHCKSGSNVFVDSGNFLMIGDSPAGAWDMSLSVSLVVCQENEDFQQEQENDDEAGL